MGTTSLQQIIFLSLEIVKMLEKMIVRGREIKGICLMWQSLVFHVNDLPHCNHGNIQRNIVRDLKMIKQYRSHFA